MLKLFVPKVNSQLDADLLQSDLNVLFEYVLLLILINIQLWFFPARLPTYLPAYYTNYHINGKIVHWAMGPVKVLGIIFDPKLKFDRHINHVGNKSD